MGRLPYWNHNAAYYPWIRKHLSGCCCVLDVGCGDGALALYLDDGTREIVGIDPDGECIARASRKAGGDNVEFIRCGFEVYPGGRVHDQSCDQYMVAT